MLSAFVKQRKSRSTTQRIRMPFRSFAYDKEKSELDGVRSRIRMRDYECGLQLLLELQNLYPWPWLWSFQSIDFPLRLVDAKSSL